MKEAKKSGEELKYYGRNMLNNSGVNLVTGIFFFIVFWFFTDKNYLII